VISLLAHQGGWDEVLLVLGPILVIAGLLRLAKRRVDRLHPQPQPQSPADPAADTADPFASADPVDPADPADPVDPADTAADAKGEKGHGY